MPMARGGKKPIPLIEYELLAARPYTYTQDDLIFEVHVRRKGITAEELAARGGAIRDELFQKPHPCMRASSLPKTYGWGVHYDEDGRIALVGRESERYREFVEAGPGGPRVLTAMRSKRE